MAPHSLPRRVACEGANAKFALVADDKALGHAQPICKNGGVYADGLSKELHPSFSYAIFSLARKSREHEWYS